jgi:hypothetical protein
VARVLAPHSDFLRAAVKAQPDISLDELSAQILVELKLRANSSMVSRELIRLTLGRKKEAPRQSARNAPSEGAARDV